MTASYDILVGMNGAGLINALYLDSHAVAIQLLPYSSSLNFDEFRSVLRARGPYLEWKSTTPPTVKHDRDSRGRHLPHSEDTIVEKREFLILLESAVSLLRDGEQEDSLLEVEVGMHTAGEF